MGETMNGNMKKIIFCLPGKDFSNHFLMSWSELLIWCVQNKIQPLISNQYSPLLYYVRNMCLGGDVLKGTKQKPFGGEVDYDYIMWIDSDTVFNPDHFKKLLEADKDIISGLYKMSDNTHYATVEKMDDEYFKEHGSYKFVKKEDIENRKELMEVDYTGFGWILMKKGVIESLEYPWFRPVWHEMEKDGVQIKDFTMEDVAFCEMIRDKGYKILIDPEVIVGHEKSFVI